MKRTVVIMAGGSGERFWPLSRKKRPKQLLKLTSPDKMMIEEAIERIAPMIPPQDIFIITSEVLQPVMREQLPILPPENIVAEPHKRNTAPCVALSAAVIAERYAKDFSPSEISVAILAADHTIQSAEEFRETVDIALRHAEQFGDLLTIGIPPLRPETGYGYIEMGKNLSENVQKVESFREKPNQETAQKFVESGKFLWNSGMFFWRLDAIIAGLKQYLPEIGGKISDLEAAIRRQPNDVTSATSEIFAQFPDISIDVGLMERAQNVAVVRALFRWDDVGSWDALERTHTPDAQCNVISGNVALVDSHDCIIVNSASPAMSVAAIGLEGIVIVTTEDGILVCPKDRVQDVKKAVHILREQHGERFV